MTTNLKNRIDVARGHKMADLVLRNGQLVNVFSGEIYRTDIAVYQGKIAGLGEYDAKQIVDVSGKFILPGFIDSHMHLESSMLTPAEFAKAALPHGTIAVLNDPHELANVLGKKGLEYLLEASERVPLDFYFMLPSCVPATALETSGARLTASELVPFMKHERVLGLAEMMNYPGVLAGDPEVLRKLERFSRTVIDGHAPGLFGRDLSAYIGAGITSDHECITADEAREKVRLGMTVFIREGSAAKDLEAILPAVTPSNSSCFCLATDDLQPGDLKQGGIDLVIKKAIELRLDPITAVRMATINPARHFGLERMGAVLPGYDANMVVIDDFKHMTIEQVYKNGKLIAENGSMLTRIRNFRHADFGETVRIRPLKREQIIRKAETSLARVIELIPDQIETRQLVMPIKTKDGLVISDTERDILKLLVIERHRASGNIGFGLVKGFGLASGAIASTVAHDSHNIIVVGVGDEDILIAVREIKKMRGGLIVVDKGKVIAALPLPVAGLISDKPLDVVAQSLSELDQAAKHLGAGLKHPFSALSFLALPVVPVLKLTDKGLVDVNTFSFVDLFV